MDWARVLVWVTPFSLFKMIPARKWEWPTSGRSDLRNGRYLPGLAVLGRVANFSKNFQIRYCSYGVFWNKIAKFYRKTIKAADE
jgi:hypothetical protein